MPTTTKHDIILFSTADWDNPFWTNKQHMAVLFAERGYRVLYVDSLGLRSPTFKGRDIKRILNRLKKSLLRPQQVRPNIWRISPLGLPFQSNKLVRTCNEILLRHILTHHLGQIGMEHPLIWTYNPVITDLCVSLPHCGIIYHCVDDLSASPYIDGTVIIRAEESLGHVADMCFTTSPQLFKRMGPLFSKTVYEPNVCDQALFSTARTALEEPDELKGIPHPRLLFVGALSQYKVDFPLMKKLAERMPENHWILLGSVGEGQLGSQGPPELPNVHALGPVAYERLPRFMAHADMVAMPIPHNAYTDSMFPMEFFESLAAGLPVVCTRLPALAEFESLYFSTKTEDDFANAIQQVLAGERRDQAAIDKACSHHSWSARFDRMEASFQPLIKKETHPPCHRVLNSRIEKNKLNKQVGNPLHTLWGLCTSSVLYPLAEKKQQRVISPKLKVLRAEAQLPFPRRKALALERLVDILRHAGCTVPYYKELFAAHSFDPEKVRKDVRYLENLPFLTKDIVREQGKRLISEPYASHIVREQKTGSSTGLAATIYYDQESLDWTAAQNILMLEWGGKKRYHREAHLSTRFAAPPPEQVHFEAQKCFVLNRKNIYTDGFDDASQERLLDDLRDAKAVVVQGHPSSLFALARYLDKQNKKAEGLFDIFISTGEVLTPTQRARIEKTLCARVSNRYGACEFGVMAQELKDGPKDQLLVSDSLVWPELHMAQGGGAGELAFTNLRNRAMPLIRYCIGDLGTLEERADGWWLSDMTGRVHDSVEIDGKVYPTHYIQDILDRCGDISDFQIVVKEEKAQELRLVAPPEHHQSVSNNVHHFFPDTPLRFIEAKDLVFLGVRGKFSYLLRKQA